MYEQTGRAGLVCTRFGISRPTLRKWLKRYAEHGAAGLDEPSRKPVNSPNQKVFEREEALILDLRRRDHLGLHKLKDVLLQDHGIDLSADTILKVLRRAGEPAKRTVKPAPLPPVTLNRINSWRGPEAQRPAPSSTAPPPTAPGDGAISVTDAVIDLIAHRELLPGQKLSERTLGTRLGLSRTLVREALKQLAFSGLVTLERHRGAFIASPSLEEVEQAYAARRLIEGEIVADVTRHCTAHDIRLLRRHVALQSEAEAAGDRGRLVRLLTEFHQVLASLGENRLYEGFLESLTAKTSLAVLLYDHDEAASCAIDDHAQLIDLLAAGDVEGAKALMQRHLSTNQQRLHAGDDAKDHTHEHHDDHHGPGQGRGV